MDRKLFEAAASGDLDFLRQTEAHKLESEVTPQQNTVLHIAVNSKQKEFAEQVLVQCPPLLWRANVKGDTPHVAARIGSLELAELLINTAKTQHEDVEGQEVNMLRMVNLEKKETALHVAARNGHLDVVKLLMKADLELLDSVNNADQSPLSLAMLQKFHSIVLHILETSPSSPCGGTNGINALHYEKLGIKENFVKIRPEMIKEADIFKRTPLHYAALRGDLVAVRLFLQRDNSAAYLFDKDEMSPLHLAAYGGHVDVAQELIQCCPYIWELLDQKGRTALHVAVIAGKEGMVKYLLEVPELDGLINEPDKEGNTPLHLAAVYNKYTIIKILAREERVDKQAMNNEFLTAMDILDSKDCFAVNKEVKSLLKTNYGILYLQRKTDTKLREGMEGMVGMEGEAAEKGKSDSVTANKGPKESKRSMFEGHLLVAALIATVTFAAAFTMPGGYKSEGPDQGMPNFIDRAVFKVFVIFDIIAFSFSVTAVYLLFHSSYKGYHNHPRTVDRVLSCIYWAMVGMVLAFVTGIHVMLAKSIGLAIAAYLMVGYFFLGFFIDWFINPRGNCIGSAVTTPWQLLKTILKMIWKLLKMIIKKAHCHNMLR